MPETITLSAATVVVILGSVLPLLVGLLTRPSLPAWQKGVLHAALAAVSGLITTSITMTGEAVISRSALVVAAGTFWAGVAAYVGLWKPAGLTSAKLAPWFGLGPRNSVPPAG